MKRSNLLRVSWNVMVLFAGLTFLPLLLNAQDKGTFKDLRDGRDYNWVKIGPQVWMAENLKFKVSAASWAYNNDSANEVKFGLLYTWKAAQAACPKGWHLPSDKEWGLLVQTLGGSSQAGLKMQSMDTVGKGHGTAGAPAPGALSSLLGGVRHPDGSCIGLNFWGGCWSSGKINDTVGSNVLFAKGSREIAVSSNDKAAGFTVRCVKNK